MKSSSRGPAIIGAFAALCLAAPAADAARPASAPVHPAHPTHPEHPGQVVTENASNGASADAPGHTGDAPGHTGDAPGHTGDAPGHADTGTASDNSAAPETAAPPANPCDHPASRQVFSPWHDNRAYVLTENGGLEQGDTGWTLANGAAVTDGNDPFFVNDAADHQSLSLPAGSSATSPATCFSAGSPTFRFLARTSGDRRARLKVEVLYTNQNGHKASRTAGKIRGGDTWRPSKRLALAIGRAKGRGRLVSGSVAFRFTPVGAGDWQVDDLFLDPRARH
jgi:hypothetical protein